MRLIAQPVNPAHAIDHAALDEVHVVALGPLTAGFEVEVSRVEGICVKADFHIKSPSVVCPVSIGRANADQERHDIGQVLGAEAKSALAAGMTDVLSLVVLAMCFASILI